MRPINYLFLALLILIVSGCPSSVDPTGIESIPEEITLQLPLPPSSARHIIGREFFPQATRLEDINTVLTPALRQAGFDQGEKLRYFVTVDDIGRANGYAILTFLEVIDEEGERLEWFSGEDAGSFWDWDLKELLRRLTFSDQDYFRFFIFLVTDASRTTSARVPRFARDEIMQKYANGLDSFRDLARYVPNISSMPVTADTDCTVLVYEFVKKQATGTTEQTPPIRLEGKEHLDKTGLKRLVEINP